MLGGELGGGSSPGVGIGSNLKMKEINNHMCAHRKLCPNWGFKYFIDFHRRSAAS